MTPPAPTPHGRESWLSALLLARKPWVLVLFGVSSQVTSDLEPPCLGHRARLPAWTHGASPSRGREAEGSLFSNTSPPPHFSE